ncbi:uncharacterized protein [Argopecten irradians]|uniref:uncharacterized protein n=1 Tax=Argopecten irradians TaxID=31199 RepID=UPI0037124B6B
MDFLPLVLLGILAICDSARAAYGDVDEHDIKYGPYEDPPKDDGGDIPPTTHECEHLYVDTQPMKCSDFITEIPRSSEFLCFVDAAHYLLYSEDYYFLLYELKQIPKPKSIPEPEGTARECRTKSKQLLGYWGDYGLFCWIVWSARQDVRCAACENEYCCREYNKSDSTHLLPPTSRCRPGGYTLQKFIVYCANINYPYEGDFHMKYTYLPSCCECKTNICVEDKHKITL